MTRWLTLLIPLCGLEVAAGGGAPLPDWSLPETRFAHESRLAPLYPEEKIASIVVEDPDALGKLTALSFLHWIDAHPEGVVALPTGKTPEPFIRWLSFYKEHWNRADVQKELRAYGLRANRFPSGERLKFVQLDEFFPIDPSAKESLTLFVKQTYIPLLEIPPENCLTMEGLIGPTLQKKGIAAVFPGGGANLNLLLSRKGSELEKLQRKALQEAEAFCASYEQTIADWGGIGFFLGGIGPDGHVAFNQKGSLHNSKTRLVELNYETAAAAAPLFGGIDKVRTKLAATIGLETIGRRPDAKIVLFAAALHKSGVVASSIEAEPCVRWPASAFAGRATFFLTREAASQLSARKHLPYLDLPFSHLPARFIDETVIGIALKLQKPIGSLLPRDFHSTPAGRFLLSKNSDWKQIRRDVEERLAARVLRASPDDLALLGADNVAFPPSLADASLFFVASQDEALQMRHALSRQLPSHLPVPSFDGPPADYALELIHQRLEQMKKLLGSRWLNAHPESPLHQAAGLLIKRMSTK